MTPRACDCGVCRDEAQWIGTYRRDNGEACTVAACNVVHLHEVAAGPELRRYAISWRKRDGTGRFEHPPQQQLTQASAG